MNGDQKILDEIAFHLDQVLQYGVPDGFTSIVVYFDEDKKPIMIMNATHQLDARARDQKGMVLCYSADPRNLHDREIFHLLDRSKIFDGFEQKPNGYEGKSFYCFFGSEKEKILETVAEIFSAVHKVIDPEKTFIRFQGLYGPQEKGFLIVD